MRPEDCQTVLGRMAVDGFDGRVFVLGCREQRVTVRDQQVRAINLAHAIEGLEDRDVAVVGGGAAGMSFAAAAAIRGARVTLYERDGALARLLSSAQSRPLEPFLFEWPREEWTRRCAGLPVLSWRSGSAKSVVVGLRERFHRLAELFGIEVRPSSTITDVVDSPDGPAVLVGETPIPHDLVVVAVGFGLERDLERFTAASSYWSDGHLDGPAYLVDGRPGEVHRYLISGCGDGGLADFLRVRLRDHSAEGIRRLLPQGDPVLESVLGAILAIDEACAEDAQLLPKYLALEHSHPEALSQLDERLRAELDETTTAVLCQDGVSPLRLSAFRINRFLAWRVLTLDGMTVNEEGQAGPKRNERGEVVAGFHRGRSVPAGQEGARIGGERFERAVVRHGPDPALSKLPTVFAGTRRAPPGAPDPTRTPLWGGGDLDEDARISSLLDVMASCRELGFLGQATQLMAWCAAHAPELEDDRRRLQRGARRERAAWVLQQSGALTPQGFPDAALRTLARALLARDQPAVAFAASLLAAMDLKAAETSWHADALQASMSQERALLKHEAIPAWTWPRGGDASTGEAPPPLHPHETRHLARAPSEELLRQLPVQLRWISGLPALTGDVALCLSAPPSAEQWAALSAQGLRAVVLPEWTTWPEATTQLRRWRGLAVCGGAALGGSASEGPVATPIYASGAWLEHLKFSRCGHPSDPSVPAAPQLTLIASEQTSALVLTCSDLTQHPRIGELLAALRPAWLLVPACQHTSPTATGIRAEDLRFNRGVSALIARSSGGQRVVTPLDEAESI